jgi:hypothetical protein
MLFKNTLFRSKDIFICSENNYFMHFYENKRGQKFSKYKNLAAKAICYRYYIYIENLIGEINYS